MTMTGNSLGLALGVALSVVVAGSAASVPNDETKPWRKDNDCSWWLSAADGKSLRASIGPSSDGVVLTIADPAFATWSQSDRIKVELRLDHDVKRRVLTKGWVTRGEGYAMFGVFMSADALRKMADASALELRRKGKVVVEQKLSGTPSKAELLDCLPGPSSGPSDSE